MDQPPKIIIGIPGAWPSRKDIVTSIALKSEGYLFAGMILMETASKEAFTLEVDDHDPRMRQAFECAGYGRFSKADLSAIASHSHTLYLLEPGGSLDAARAMMRAACGLLRVGGLAVKVESAGVAHLAESWFRMADNPFVLNLYQAYVALVGGAGGCFSCGMHNLGFRDAIVGPDDATTEYASQLLNQFHLYALLENPVLESGHTFSLDAEAPRFRLRAETCSTYPPDDPFHNPFGMWRLTRVER
jgi:hypothetical protein